MAITLPRVPNGGVQPPRAHQKHCQKTNDLARAAVGWNDVFGDPVAIARAADRMCRPHRHRTTPAQRAFGHHHAQHRTTPGTTDFDLEPHVSGITLPTTCLQHHGPSYYTLHNGQSA